VSSRRAEGGIAALWREAHVFEILAAGNFLVVLLAFGASRAIAGNPLVHLIAIAVVLAIQALGGIAVRSLFALLRRERSYFRRIARREWWLDTLRIVLFGSVTIVGYGWIKLVVPLYHPRLLDEQLWQLDRILFFGLSPAELALHLFDAPRFLRLIDWSYASIFYASTVIAFGYFASEPSRRLRIAFANGNTLLWIAGAWLYLLVPSLGPAYRFPDVWLAHAESLRTTQGLQAVLMRNYSNVLRAAAGEPHGPIGFVFGIAAFPSLHVAFQTFVFFWFRRLWTSGEVLFAIFALTIFIGSMVTGWHYLVDGIFGVAMAWICYRTFWRRARLDRWLELQNR
jgi:hypothetical protein